MEKQRNDTPHYHEQIVKIMGNSTCERSQGLELFYLFEMPLQCLCFRDITNDHQYPGRLAFMIGIAGQTQTDIY